MADLRFIMDMDDHEPVSRIDKKDHETPPEPPRGSDPSRSAPHIDSRSYQDHHDRPNSASSFRIPGLSSRPSTSSAAATPASSTASDRTGLARRESTASTESMDPTGYAGRGLGQSSGPMRPMGSPSASEQGVRLTPITRRVSRAKKGVPVHTCDICRPAKTFTRAEHLRRHKLSHETPRYACLHPGCDKVFHRQDLLSRHKTRHEQEALDPTVRRESTVSGDGHLSYGPGSPAIGLGVTGGGMDLTTGNSYGSDISTSYHLSSHGSGQGSATSPQSSHQHHRSGYDSGNHYDPRQVPAIYEQSETPTTPLHTRIDSRHFGPQSSHFSFVDPALGDQLPALTIPDNTIPGLLAPHDSPWASSASESNFSTPSEARRRRSHGRALSPQTQISDWSGLTYAPGSPIQSLEVGHGSSLFPSHPFSSYHQQHLFIPDIPVSYQEDHVAILEHAHGHDPYSSVRSLTPQITPSGAQTAEHLVTLSNAVPGTIPVLDLGVYKDSTSSMPPFYRGNLRQAAMSLPRSVLDAIPHYLEVYWARFDKQFPFIHRASFANTSTETLRCIMAAIGTQFMPAAEDHVKGKQLYEYALKELNQEPALNKLPMMQAIVLCEYYTRYRGTSANAVLTPSKLFREIYSRVVRTQNTIGTTYQPTTVPSTTDLSAQLAWKQWVDRESRRRLYAACFILDVNTSVYYQQDLSYPITTSSPAVPLTTPTSSQWAAESLRSWEADAPIKHDCNPASGLQPLTDVITSSQVQQAPCMDAAVYLAAETLRMMTTRRGIDTTSLDLVDMTASERICRLFPSSSVASTYMALSYTPLHDLLAVSGDSWIFGSKIMTPKQFCEHKRRLENWCQGSQVGPAVKFAAQALYSFLTPSDEASTATNGIYPQHGNTAVSHDSFNTDQQTRPKVNGVRRTQKYSARLDPIRMGRKRQSSIQKRPEQRTDSIEQMLNYGISDFWAVYVCTLICWAVAHHNEIRQSSNTALQSPRTTTFEESQEWLTAAADCGPEQALLTLSSGIALQIIETAKRRLEAEAASDTSGLLNDAIHVLTNLHDDPKRVRF